MCNSLLYNSMQLCHNSISLLLFFDGASFTKTGKGKLWAIFGFIINLPPSIRNFFYNILKLFFITGSFFNFNGIFNKHMNDFKEMLQNGINLGDKTIMIYIFGAIADALGTALICNCKQFNGQFGCLKCVHPGTTIGKKRVYSTQIEPIKRTVEIYQDQLNIAIAINGCHEGIKGPIFLSDFMCINLQCFIDYMHACLEG